MQMTKKIERRVKRWKDKKELLLIGKVQKKFPKRLGDFFKNKNLSIPMTAHVSLNLWPIILTFLYFLHLRTDPKLRRIIGHY